MVKSNYLNPEYINNLGICYGKGLIVSEDPKKAFGYYQLAAKIWVLGQQCLISGHYAEVGRVDHVIY